MAYLWITSILFCVGYVTSNQPFTFVRDLTHKLHPGIPVYPGISKLSIDTFLGKVSNSIYKAENISTTTHIGTHVDAPSHFANGTWNIDEIPLDRLFAPAVVIDIRHKTLKNSDAELSVDDLVAWELRYGRIPVGAVILVLTGWDRYWKDADKYLGIKSDGSRSTPGISVEAAKWIAQNTKAYGVGIDTISIDSVGKVDAHLILARHSFYNIENLKDLDKVPPIGATIYIIPMKIKLASGAPARVIATHAV